MKKRIIPGTICLLILVGVIFLFYSYTSGQGLGGNNAGFGNTNGNLVNGGNIVKSGDWIYFSGYEGYGYGQNAFYRAKVDGSQREKLLDKSPTQINIYRGFVFFTNGWYGNLCRMKEDGNDFVDFGVWASTVNVVDGTVYYVGGDSKKETYANADNSHESSLYKMDMNCKNKQLLFTESEMIVNVNISDGYIYYSIGNTGSWSYDEPQDHRKIQRRTFDGKNRETVVKRDVEMFVVDGAWIYYVGMSSGSGDGNIYKSPADGKGDEVQLLSGLNAYIKINVDSGKLYVYDGSKREVYTTDFDGKNKKVVFSYDEQDYSVGSFFAVFDGYLYNDKKYAKNASYALNLKNDKKLKLNDTYIYILKVDDEYIYYDDSFEKENWYGEKTTNIFKMKHNGEGTVKIAEIERYDLLHDKLNDYDLYFIEGQDIMRLSLKDGKKIKLATFNKGCYIDGLQSDESGYVYYVAGSEKTCDVYKVKGDGTSKAQLVKSVKRVDYSGISNMIVMDGWIYYTDKMPGKSSDNEAIYKMKTDGTAVQMIKESNKWIFDEHEEVHELWYERCDNLSAGGDGYIYYTISNGEGCSCGADIYYRIKGDGTGKERMGSEYLSNKYSYEHGGWRYFVDPAEGEYEMGDGNILKVKNEDKKILENGYEANINLYGDTLFYSYKKDYSNIVRYAAK